MSPLAVSLLLAAALAAPPFASVPADVPTQAATPLTWDSLSQTSLARSRWSLGLGLNHSALRSPGGNAPGLGVELAIEERRSEWAAQLWYYGGVAAQDERGRNTGISSAAVKALYRVVPVEGASRFMVGGGLQLGREGAWAFCVKGSESDVCRPVKATFSAGLVGGVAYLVRGGPGNLTAGLDVVLKGPRVPAAVFAAPVALQLWFSAGIGGIKW